jgi:hypothetical protein
MGGAVLMYFRFLHPPDALQQQTRMHRSPVSRLSNVSVSLLASLLGFSLPVSAKWIAWSTSPPISQTRPPQSEALTPENIAQKKQQNNPLPPLLRQEKVQPQKPGDEENYDKSKSIHDSLLATFSSPERSGLVFFLFAFLLLLLLAILAWLTYQASASAKSTVNFLRKDLSALKIDLQKFIESTNKQALILEQTSHHVVNLAKGLATHESTISSLRQKLRDQDERLLGLQTSHQAKLETLKQASRPVFVQVEASQPIDKQQTLKDLVASLVEEYQTAFFRGDRSSLRNMSSDQLNITQSSEDSLVKTSVLPTLLEVVQNGGSYLLISRDDRHWLVPEFQILTSFTTTQPAKGIFAYHRENISTADLRWPAEVREVGGLWEVVNMGLIAVPS